MSERLILGTTYPVFIGVTLVCMCGCAILMGRALARAWRPARHALPYGLLLALSGRFLIYALFDGDISSPTGFVIDLYCIQPFGRHTRHTRDIPRPGHSSGGRRWPKRDVGGPATVAGADLDDGESPDGASRSLSDFAKKNRIEGGSFSAIGAFQEATTQRGTGRRTSHNPSTPAVIPLTMS